jgi:hypothetical protein
MMRLTIAVMMVCAVSCLGFAKPAPATDNGSQKYTGYLIDKMCGMKDAKLEPAQATEKAMKHSKDCALEDMCKADGYGIISNGKFIKFDETGDKLASAYFDKSNKEDNFLVDVEGSMDGNILKVASINEPEAMVATKKPSGVHSMHGYMLDVACGTKMSKLSAKKAEEKAKAHTKDCALQDACKASGYGLMMHGKLMKFDDNGNKLAAAYFDKTKKEKDFWVDVKGTMEGNTIKVESIK